MSKPTKKLSIKNSTKNLLIAFLFFVSLFSILLTSLKPEKFDLMVGQRAPEDIRAPKDIEDKIATEDAKQKAIDSVDPIYRINPGVHVEVKKDIENFFLLAYRLRNDEDLEEDEKIAKLTSENDLNIRLVNTRVGITAPLERLQYLESYINEIVTQNMNMGIKVEDLQKQKNSIRDYISNLDDFDNELKDLAISIINATIRPNRFLDEEATNRAIELVKENTEKVLIRKGDHIIREGEAVTEDKIELLRELGILTEESKFDFVLHIGIGAIVLIIQLLIIAYIIVFNRDLLKRPERLLMIYIIFVSTLIISKVMEGISIYIIPLATSSMLLSILIESRLALLINLCLTILISIITGNNIIFIVMALIGGTVAAFSVINTQQRASIFLSGIAVSIANMVAIIGSGFINSNEVMEILTFAFYGLLNGLLCTILTVGSLPLWEYLFNIVTPLKLLELSNPNQPLLKKLLIEAPGTYHHSIIVGNLSEAAADLLGANSLLARVGAFYHDIGKTKRPYFFKENQLSSDNPHDRLDPYLSASIITDHVKDGMELARKYKLPDEVSDFIVQHHGTTLVAYFYHKARTEKGEENVEEKDFRYGGPKPQTKEIAIVMLADSVEAAVRSLSSPTRERVESLIEKIIDDKLRDGQFDQCNLTLKEIEAIKKSFTKVILSIFHERIEYPNMEEEKEDGGSNNGTSN